MNPWLYLLSTMCSLLKFPNTPGYANDDDWNEDYRYKY